MVPIHLTKILVNKVNEIIIYLQRSPFRISPLRWSIATNSNNSSRKPKKNLTTLAHGEVFGRR
jgi:hypothetical protein